jgi:membrane protein
MTARDWIVTFKRAGKKMLDDHMPMIAQALAFSAFFAIPSVLLVAVGLFTLIADRGAIDSLIQRLHSVMPHQATELLSQSLHRLDAAPGTSIAITVVGLVLAIWSTTSAMTAFMTAVNLAYDRHEKRKFVRKRLTALLMAGCIGLAFGLVAVLLIFGPTIEKHLGRALGIPGFLGWVWWTAEWPILVAGLLAAFAALLYLGPDDESRNWRLFTPGAVIAVVIWLVVSAAFAFYTASFGSYNKTWGSLAGVIITLTWLWLAGLALLFGAEVNSELERAARERASLAEPRPRPSLPSAPVPP